VLVPHWTQVDSLVLQTGVAPLHSELDVQPGMHVKERGLQIGLAAPQSVLSRHATHCPVAPKHRGAAAGQSESCAHATHWLVDGLQILSPPVQSVALMHPTQKPPLGSHFGASLGHTDAMFAVVHAG
jgi:hypothetical protein